MKKLYQVVCLANIAIVASAAHGQENTIQVAGVEEVFVTGGKDAISTTAGSAHLLDSEQLEKFDYSDINNVLTQVPGVYIRYEDGFGLRPNIGIRGATSERSQKITIMEDGIVITPAPYSAPAAYYLPNVGRMEAVETFKGPAGIKYGPHTVGGALNLVTPSMVQDEKGELDVTVGSHGYEKYRLFYGQNFEQFGYWIEGMQYGADGFKELDTGGDTGFTRNDINAKFQIRSRADAKIEQRLDIKVGYADEDSDETYLGLSDEDFALNPDRRYAASELDLFDSEHTQVHLLHFADFGNGWESQAKAYVNRFDRSWEKFDGFIAGVDTQTVLANPDIYFREMELLRGEVNSDGTPEETIEVTTNAREYGSQGIDLAASYRLDQRHWDHEFSMGVRFHHDYVDRDHRVEGYLIDEARLIDDGIDYQNNALNRAETDALAVYFANTITYGDWKVDLGIRAENIDNRFDDELNQESRERSDSVVIPGVGVFYQWTEHFGVLFGANKGFSPAGPSAAEEVEAEESQNFEYGFRYIRDNFDTEVIGFYSDYSNLLGRCRASDAGCQVGDEFNGGSVDIAGLEWVSNYAYQLAGDLIMPISLVYTYTESAFQTDFSSSFSQWGNVSIGDELPYLPEHVGRFDIGLENAVWSVYLGLRYTGETREIAGQGEKEAGLFTPAYTTADLAANYDLRDNLRLQLKVDNLTDEREIVSRRPFGARPNLPRTYSASLKYSF